MSYSEMYLLYNFSLKLFRIECTQCENVNSDKVIHPYLKHRCANFKTSDEIHTVKCKKTLQND